jgi:hypothetical protein
VGSPKHGNDDNDSSLGTSVHLCLYLLQHIFDFDLKQAYRLQYIFEPVLNDLISLMTASVVHVTEPTVTSSTVSSANKCSKPNLGPVINGVLLDFLAVYTKPY